MQDSQNNIQYSSSGDTEASIFDDIKLLPVYYSPKALFGFSVFFGPLFGAVLMALNLRRAKAEKGMWMVLAMGILLTILQIWLMSSAPSRNSNSSAFFGGLASGMGIRYFFWPKYIGANTPYSKRPVWVPMIVGCAIACAYVYASSRHII